MEAAGGEEGGTNFSQIIRVFVFAMDFFYRIFAEKAKLHQLLSEYLRKTAQSISTN